MTKTVLVTGGAGFIAHHVAKLNLPPVEPELAVELISYLKQVPLDLDKKRWLDEFHNHSINSAAHNFFFAPDHWQTRIKNLYQSYFDHEITVAFGIMKNVQDQPACLPPHSDRARGLAINYYLELGGSSVTTLIYDKVISTNLDQATNMLYDDIGPALDQQQFDCTWYAYNVNQVHSVENILNERYILILMLQTLQSYNLNDFIVDYPNLIDHCYV
jgi:hypothetical protein